MHQKKHKSHKFHSIPISLCRNNCKRLYLVSYSIPLGCMVALLLLGIIAINPNLGDLLAGKSSALTIQDEWVVTNPNDPDSSTQSENSEKLNTLLSDYGNSSNPDNSSEDEMDDSFGGFGGDDANGGGTVLSQSDQDAGISLMSIVPTPTLSITVSNTSQTIQAVQGGDTVYGSYDVSLSGSNVKDYTLSIKADSVNLTMPSGASSSTSTIGGAGGKTGNSMSNNTWGYKLTETNTDVASYSTLTYASLPTSLTQIANSTVSSPYNLSTSKKLVFAAKFAETAAPGNYSGHITLSAVASQAVVGAIWSNGVETNITDMQDISSGFCKNNSKIATGDTIALKDSRDTNSYTIVKLEDNNCWMQQNLRLTGGKTLKPSDSNVSSDWSMPATLTSLSSSNFSTSNYYATESYYSSSTLSANGVYYSFTAATAGAATSSVTSGDVGGTAGNSICPKGWMLPTNSEYSNMLSQAGIGNNSAGSTKIRGDKYRFPYAGYIDAGSLSNVGSYGYYWSRTVDSSHNAYFLFFRSSNVTMYNDGYRFCGYSVRCVADY